MSGAGAVPVPLEEATFKQRKDGAMLYTEAYCRRLMQKAEAAAPTERGAEVAASAGHGAEVAASTGQCAEIAASTSLA